MIFFILAIDYFDNGDFGYIRVNCGSDYREFTTKELAEHYAKTFYKDKKYKVFRVGLV